MREHVTLDPLEVLDTSQSIKARQSLTAFQSDVKLKTVAALCPESLLKEHQGRIYVNVFYKFLIKP